VEVVASLSQGRTAAAKCGLFTHKSVPVIFEPPCIITASVIVTLCKRPYSMPVESGLSPLSTSILYGRLQRVTIPDAVIIQFCPPEDEHSTTRNMLRIIM